jgi:hypothetical protein
MANIGLVVLNLYTGCFSFFFVKDPTVVAVTVAAVAVLSDNNTYPTRVELF